MIVADCAQHASDLGDLALVVKILVLALVGGVIGWLVGMFVDQL